MYVRRRTKRTTDARLERTPQDQSSLRRLAARRLNLGLAGFSTKVWYRCGATNAIGELAAYMHGMGTVLRCQSCDQALMRVAHANGQYWLDMRGVRVLRISEEMVEAK